MRNYLLALGAFAVALPTTMILPTDHADAKRKRNYQYKEWRGNDGRMRCRKSNGTTGMIVGAAGGALAGRAIDTRGERTTGTLLGAVAGGVIGKSIDSKRTCR